MKYEPDPSLEWAGRVLLRTEVGSTAHGISLEGTDDYDEVGIYAAHPDDVVSGRSENTIVYRPGRGPEERSQAGDYDLTVHTAQKFVRLAAGCNPSILMVLYGPVRYSDQAGLGLELINLRENFWNVKARDTFLGYATQQRERLEGIRGGKHTNRPELIEKYGYDTKYAGHLIRLLLQGKEYVQTAHITSPMSEAHRELITGIRKGEMTLDEVVELSHALEKDLKNLSSDIPTKPNMTKITKWLHDVFDWSRS